jgi:SAM-dependent methyltransferase
MYRVKLTVALLCVLFGDAGFRVASRAWADGLSPGGAATLRAADLLRLKELSEGFFAEVPNASLLNMQEVVAFEENPHFVYVSGRDERVVRRLLLLKPNTFIIEDRLTTFATDGSGQWTLPASSRPRIDGSRFRVPCGQSKLVGRVLWPENVQLVATGNGAGSENTSPSGLQLTVGGDGWDGRLLLVAEFASQGQDLSGPECALTNTDRGRRLTVTLDDLAATLSLPAERDAAGTIALSGAEGRSILSERLLPSGILPHGEQGVALIRRWDTPYQDGRRPGWDTGRVAPELKRLFEAQPAPRGRAIVLGCGTGTNAIYLAEQGFDVIGVDVAATALARARDKAREAGVRVRWVLADVLALPDMEPVDLVFDRGCYHHVRQYNAAGYVNSVLQISQPGTQVLLLAGSANDSRRGGPPKIKEEEIRGDFAPAFDFQWFREIRFDSGSSSGQGSLAWSVLMRRKLP